MQSPFQIQTNPVGDTSIERIDTPLDPMYEMLDKSFDMLGDDDQDAIWDEIIEAGSLRKWLNKDSDTNPPGFIL